MTIKIESLRTTDLTNMEVGQLMNRHLNDLTTIDPKLLTDAPYNDYVSQLTSKSSVFQKALVQVRKNQETEKIIQADEDRDKAIEAYRKSLQLYKVSDDPAEVEAVRVLGILMGSYKNLARLNYEAETIGIDKLMSDLESPKYVAQVALLNIGRYVDRMKVTNQNFKTLFSARMVTGAMTETYNVLAIRKELLKQYTDFTAYVLAMAKALDTPLFNAALTLLNTARKYYADMLARRSSLKAAKEKPAV
jgi:hypothetical protein